LPADRPLLIYDGDCGFCRRWVERFRRISGETVEYRPSQEVGDSFLQIPREGFGESVWLVEPDGRTSAAAEAVFRTLALAGRRRWLWGYEHLPGLARASEALYRLVSHNRGPADRIDLWLFPDPQDKRRSYALTRSIFLRGLGVVYLVAFLSLWVQIDGLIGGRGILPAGDFLAAVRTPDGSAVGEFFRLPTLCWISSTDSFLHVLTLAGAILAGVLILGFFPMPVLALLWLFYLSLVNVGQIFLGYQWDALLLEAGFLAIFFAPLTWRLGLGAAPSRIVLFLLRWLLFRLMFLSALVKLIDGGEVWRGLTALHYHYWTQPLPTWTSWYVNLAPNWFQALSVLGVFFVEGLVPILFFSRRSRRLFACATTILFQVLIAATGNYGFFNLLAIVLCLTLIDDAAWSRVRLVRTAARRGREVSAWVTLPLAIVLFPLTFVPALRRVGLDDLVPRRLAHVWRTAAAFESINAYGLFGSMTTRRPELIVEGSDDGKSWLAYQFKWKPGDVKRAPRFCEPHMPRLDWQMWFAALDVEQGRLEGWVPMFLDRLHEGSPAVVALLRTNPFPDHPPRYLRVLVYEYHFTTYAERSSSGAWWQRDYLGELPVGVNR
jgi:predicted DCC family thiol-disulfide oxidoreductase YuxK